MHHYTLHNPLKISVYVGYILRKVHWFLFVNVSEFILYIKDIFVSDSLTFLLKTPCHFIKMNGFFPYMVLVLYVDLDATKKSFQTNKF